MLLVVQDVQQQEYIRTARTSGDALVALINDVLGQRRPCTCLVCHCKVTAPLFAPSFVLTLRFVKPATFLSWSLLVRLASFQCLLISARVTWSLPSACVP